MFGLRTMIMMGGNKKTAGVKPAVGLQWTGLKQPPTQVGLAKIKRSCPPTVTSDAAKLHGRTLTKLPVASMRMSTPLPESSCKQARRPYSVQTGAGLWDGKLV